MEYFINENRKLVIELLKEYGKNVTEDNIQKALKDTKDMDYYEMKEYFLN